MRIHANHIKKVAALALFWTSVGAVAQDPSYCSAILQHGVFDSNNVLDAKSKYDLVNSALCQSSEKNDTSSASLAYESFSATGNVAQNAIDKYCSSTYEQSKSDALLVEATRKASAAIVGAWTTCVTSNVGLVHWITPLIDPHDFAYKIIYKSNGAPYTVNLVNWKMSPKVGTSCDGPNPKTVGSGGYSMICHRKNTSTAIAITTNTVGETGTQNLGTAQLGGYIPSPVPPPKISPPSLVDKLFKGNKCHVTLNAPYENGCVVGTLARGSPGYDVEYVGNTQKGEWIVSGPICNKGENQTASTGSSSPNGGYMDLWNTSFNFAPDGKVTFHDKNISGVLICP